MLGDWRFQRIVLPVSDEALTVTSSTKQEVVDANNILSTKRRREGVDYVQLQLEVSKMTYPFKYYILCYIANYMHFDYFEFDIMN